MGVHELTHQKVCHVLIIRTGSVPVSHHVFLYHTMYSVVIHHTVSRRNVVVF